TPLGEKMLVWQNTARDYANAWIFQRGRGSVESTFLGTCPAPVRNDRNRVFQNSLVTASLASVVAALADGGQSPPLARFAPLFDVKIGCQLYMPGFQHFSPDKFLDKTEFEAPRKHKEQILAEFYKNFLHPEIMG